MQAPVAPMAMARSAPVAESAQAAADSVTNNQTAGVDEGGIVKVHGKHLVVLRRGRLFTVDVDKNRLAPVSYIDAFAPGTDPAGAWYDEMLIDGNTIVVIGYSFQRGGTEIGLFGINDAGKLSYRSTYHMRSNDYYSSRNYASRLIGHKLVFYTPLHIGGWGNWENPWAAFPAVRKWHRGALPSDFKRMAPATRIYRTDAPLDENAPMALHTVSVCDLAQPEMACQATAVMGPPGRVFYVASHAVYVWTTSYRPPGLQQATSGLFRIPLDGTAPSAIKTSGAPIDQFSFLESDDQHLNVLVRSQGAGDAMWAAERSSGATALLRLPLASLGDGRDTAPASAYRPLPSPTAGEVQNRYIGNYLLYGSGNNWGAPKAGGQPLFAVRWDKAQDASSVALAHSVDRIEALGEHAVAVGNAGNTLYFSSIRLNDAPAVASIYTQDNAAQGETRSHGFFYKPETATEGLLGLPIAHSGRPGPRQLRQASASVLFLKNQSLHLKKLGALNAHPTPTNDGCRASCVDWYGNSRPLFLRNRVFALMGYEIVEGQVGANGIRELRRVQFAPRPALAVAQ